MLSNGATQKNDTGNSLLNMLPISVQILRKGVRNLIAGRSGGNNEAPPPDYRPGLWKLFPSFDFDPLLWYNLQWDQEEQVSLFPKHIFGIPSCEVGRRNKSLMRQVKCLTQQTFTTSQNLYVLELTAKYEFICFILFFRVALEIFVLVKGHATARCLLQRCSTSTSKTP